MNEQPTDDYSTRRLAYESSKYGAATAAVWGGIQIAGGVFGTPLPAPIGAVAAVGLLVSMATMLLALIHLRPLLDRFGLWYATRDYRE